MSSSVEFENCIFSGNRSFQSGGGLVNWNNDSAVVYNCTFSGNKARYDGSGVHNINSATIVTNTIFWDNSSSVYNNGNDDDLQISYSCVQGGFEGEGNISDDPMIVELVNGSFCLLPESPCVNQGNNETGNMLELDFLGNIRVQDDFVDMGAVESNSESQPVDLTVYLGPDKALELGGRFRIQGRVWTESSAWCQSGDNLKVYPGEYKIEFSLLGNWMEPLVTTVIVPESGLTETYNYMYSTDYRVWFVDIKAMGSGDGSSWNDAYNNIQPAVELAKDNGGGEVWIAEGTYTSTVTMRRDVALYGGFSGRESARSERDWNVNETRIDGRGRNLCVIGADHSVLDGIIIGDGKAGSNGGGLQLVLVSKFYVSNCDFMDNHVDESGGGLYSFNSEYTIKNCMFSNNWSDKGSGIYNECTLSSIVSCTFDRNVGRYGVGVFNLVSNCTIEGSEFSKSYCSGSGGGIYNKDSQFFVSNSLFDKNNSTHGDMTQNDGGAILSSNSTSILKGCNFSGNAADEGGAIKLYSSTMEIRDCIFSENYSPYNKGGGI